MQNDEVVEDETEPPVPPGLGAPSVPLAKLVEFLRIDEDLLAAAAERSAAELARDEGLAEWISALPSGEKDRLLLETVEGDGAGVGVGLLARYRATRKTRRGRPAAAGGAARTAGELLEAAARIREEREREAARRRAAKRAEKQAAAAKARAAHLDELATREEAAWLRVEALLDEMKAKAYDEAVSLLVDLRDFAARREAIAGFRARFSERLGRHMSRRAVIDRVRRAGLADALRG